jgi:hypothetical protein
VELTWFNLIKENKTRTISDVLSTTKVIEDPKPETKRCYEKLLSFAHAIKNKPFFYKPNANVKETWKDIGGDHDNGVREGNRGRGKYRTILSTTEDEMKRMLKDGNTLQNLYIGSTEEYSHTCNPMPESVACEVLELIMSAEPEMRVHNIPSKADSNYTFTIAYKTSDTKYGKLPDVFLCYVKKNTAYDTLALRYYLSQSYDMENFKDVTVEDMDWRKW